MSNWIKWSQARPQDPAKLYRWRVSPRLILGLELQPEWTEKMRLCGMGYKDSEYWPASATYWDGSNRTYDPSLEWREALENEKESDEFIQWNGLNLLNNPFDDSVPKIKIFRMYASSPPYEIEYMSIDSGFIHFISRDAKHLVEKWNQRVPIKFSTANYDLPFVDGYKIVK